jgi:hypothetical protein
MEWSRLPDLNRRPADYETRRRIVEQNPGPPRSSNVLLLRWEGG